MLTPNSLAHSLIVALFTNKVIYLNHLSRGNFVLEIMDDVLSSMDDVNHVPSIRIFEYMRDRITLVRVFCWL